MWKSSRIRNRYCSKETPMNSLSDALTCTNTLSHTHILVHLRMYLSVHPLLTGPGLHSKDIDEQCCGHPGLICQRRKTLDCEGIIRNTGASYIAIPLNICLWNWQLILTASSLSLLLLLCLLSMFVINVKSLLWITLDILLQSHFTISLIKPIKYKIIVQFYDTLFSSSSLMIAGHGPSDLATSRRPRSKCLIREGHLLNPSCVWFVSIPATLLSSQRRFTAHRFEHLYKLFHFFVLPVPSWHQ